MRALIRTVFLVSLTATIGACGGAQSEAKEPETETPAAASEGEESAASDTASPEAESAESGASDTEAKTEEKPFKSPKDVITSPDVMFVFSFAASEPYQAAEESCEKKAKGDPQKRAECMSKASSQFDPDGIHFTQDADGKWWWLTERRKGNSLVTLHKIEIEFGEEKDNTITIKPKGRDKGTKPMAVPQEVVIEVPSPAQIVLQDPKHGKMVYEAKVGLVGEVPPAK